MRRYLIVLLIIGLLASIFPKNEGNLVFAQEDSFNPHYLVSDAEMLDVDSMNLRDIELFLKRGGLSDFTTLDLDGIERTAAEILYNAAQASQISPKFLLVLLQREQSLVEDDFPSQRQLDWAMGYAVCDSCSKDDPRLAKFKGFAEQIHYAAMRIRESYLTDLESRGFTETGIGPGIEIQINGTTVVPVNFATSALYTYTPHLHGNENFVKIWDKWFSREYLSGSLLQDSDTGGIWLIQHGLRRPITSRTAFYSRFNPNLVIPVNASDLENYEIGSPISFPNYSLLRSPTGTVYLIVDDEKRGFESQEAFRAIGFSPDEVVDVTWEDLDAYSEGLPIDVATVYPKGALLQDAQTGGVYYVQDGNKHPIHSREILMNRFENLSITAVDSEALHEYERSEPVLFSDGTLVAAEGSPDVFVISEGQRHHITDELTFSLFGWSFDQVVWTNERSVLLHPLADPIDAGIKDRTIDVARF